MPCLPDRKIHVRFQRHKQKHWAPSPHWAHLVAPGTELEAGQLIEHIRNHEKTVTSSESILFFLFDSYVIHL